MGAGEEAKNSITVDYLIDLISSIKAALHNTDSVGAQNNEILSEISENLAIFAELYKKQTQDQKITQVKLEELIRSVQDLGSKLEINKQQILSSNESVNSKVSVINEFKKESLDELTKSIDRLNESVVSVQSDVTYLKNRETQKEIVINLEAKKIEKKKEDEEVKDKEEKKSLFAKITAFIKNINDSVSTLYKILLLLLGVVLIVLFLTGVITWQEIVQIVGLKFFQ